MFILEVLEISPDVMAKRELLILHKPAAPQFGKWFYLPKTIIHLVAQLKVKNVSLVSLFLSYYLIHQ